MTSAAAALRHWERRQEVVANNLANVSTTGFKAERVFSREAGDAIPVPDAVTDRRAGALQPTGEPLDLALEHEDAFFVIQTSNGERLTRGGSFRLDPEGRVVDAGGNALLTTDGELILPTGPLTIDASGVVHVGERAIAQLRIETVPRGAALQHEGGTRFLPDPSRQPLAPGERPVRQGFLEDSNVSSVSAMVDLIEIQRAYASVQKAITTLDGIRGVATTEIGKPV
jgi:flagellar basal body rod protein FlgG